MTDSDRRHNPAVLLTLTALILVGLLGAMLTGCVTQAPQQVQDSAAHQLEDFALAEAELLPFIPADAMLEYTTLTGDTGTMNARELWKGRIRSFMFRGAGLLAWSRGEEYDEQAAFAKFFPDQAAPAAPGDKE